MDANTGKALGRSAPNLKRKQGTERVAHLNGDLRPVKRDCPTFTTPTRQVVKHIRLGGHERKLTNCGPGNSQRLVRYYLNYKKSRKPERLMFHQNGEWLDYPKDVVDLVKKDFETKKVAAVEVEFNGNDIVLDFLHMYQMDLKSGFQQPIAWIDEAGCCFFPEVYDAANEEPYNFCKKEGAESHETHESNEINLHLAIEINGEDDSKLAECSENSNALVKDVKLEPSTDNGDVGEAIKKNEVMDVESLKRDRGDVQKMFLTGMTSMGVTDSDIVEICRCSGMSLQARLELFQKQAEITKAIQGDANIRYAWIAVSKKELPIMMQYGLGHCGLSSSKCVYGFGVHLAALTCPYTCAPFCDVDENGVKHLVLCRVIMGKMELLQPGSGQTRPRGFEYGNGVDDIQSPNCYVVWNMNVNTHIYPLFVVSFKVPLVAEGRFFTGPFFSNESKKNVSGDSIGSHGSRESSTVDSGNSLNVGARNQKPSQFPFLPQGNAPNMGARNPRPPQSPYLPFPLLFAALSPRVSPAVTTHIRAYYALFLARKMSRPDFVMKLRLLVGDPLLKATIMCLQLTVPSTDEWKGLNIKQEG